MQEINRINRAEDKLTKCQVNDKLSEGLSITAAASYPWTVYYST